MLKVHDLSLENDILPLFNYTNSHEAEALLKLLISRPLASPDQLYGRQQIIQAFIQNWQVLEDFSYQRLDYREVKAFLDDVAAKKLVLETQQLKAVIKLTYNDSRRQQLSSKCIQTINFFHRLSSRFFSRLSVVSFPDEFRKHFQVLNSFCSKVAIAKQAALVAQQRFNLKATVHFSQRLALLTPEEVSAVWSSLATIEAYFSIAKGIRERQFSFPTFTDNGFELQDFYHPLLQNPVKNNLYLAATDHVVLLTGPNMSGKSTLLRAVSLCVYLAHIGFAVPASAAAVPYFGAISVAINTNDSLQDGYSHFMAEVKNLKTVVQEVNRGQHCFAIFDELFRGTNSHDALDITATTIKGLAKYAGCYFFISTHLLELKEPTSIAGVKQLSIGCTLQGDLPVFTYRLQEGWSELKIGRILFEKEGIPELLRAEVQAL